MEGKDFCRVVKRVFIVLEDLILSDSKCFALSHLLTGKMR